MRKLTKGVLWGLAFLFAFVLIWRKIRIVIFVHTTFWQLLLLFVILAGAIYLVFEVLMGQSDEY